MARITKIFRHLNALRPSGFWPGFIAGSLYFAYVFWWSWSLFPLEFLGIQNKPIAALLVLVIFLLFIAITALFWGLFGLFGSIFLRKKCWSAALPPLFAGIFVIAEYARSIFFSIFWYGSGGRVGPHWSLGNPAYWFVNFKPVALTASIWGIYGISFWLIFVLTSLVLLVFKKNRTKILVAELIGIITVFTIFFTALSYSHNHNLLVSDPIPIAIIQTNSPSVEFTNQDNALEDFTKKTLLLTKAAESIGEGIIIFPEGANFSKSLSQLLDPPAVQKYFKNLSNKEILIFDSLRVLDEYKFKSKSVLISSMDGLIDSYDKEILTPHGEFLAYIIKLPLMLLNPALREQFKTYREYSPGSDNNIISYKDKNIKILICSELASPLKSRKHNADFIIGMGSFSVWGESLLAANQALAMSRLRAIENGKYIVFSSNAGRSYIINPVGDIEKITSPNTYELLTGRIVPNSNQTWYNKLGDWPILLVSLIILGLGLITIRNDKTN